MPCWRKKEAKLRDEKKSCEKDENSLKIRNIRESDYLVENEETSKNHPEIILNCEECAFQTNLDGDLKKHIADNHSMICDYCDFVGKNLTGLNIHIR